MASLEHTLITEDLCFFRAHGVGRRALLDLNSTVASYIHSTHQSNPDSTSHCGSFWAQAQRSVSRGDDCQNFPCVSLDERESFLRRQHDTSVRTLWFSFLPSERIHGFELPSQPDLCFNTISNNTPIPELRGEPSRAFYMQWKCNLFLACTNFRGKSAEPTQRGDSPACGNTPNFPKCLMTKNNMTLKSLTVQDVPLRMRICSAVACPSSCSFSPCWSPWLSIPPALAWVRIPPASCLPSAGFAVLVHKPVG